MGIEPVSREWSRRLAVFLGFVLLGLVAWLDYKTGIEIAVSIFYLVPVALAAWYAGLLPGLGMSVAAAVLWLVMDYKIGDHLYSSPLIAYWNSLVRLLFFVFSAVSLWRLRKSLEAERAASKLKSEMVSMVSHEFNNSLATVNLISTLLQETEGGCATADRKKLYGILDQTSGNLQLMVKNFLNKARLEAGRFALELKPTELRRIVMEVVRSLSPLSAEKGIAVRTSFPPEVIPVKVDRDAISLVLNNLIGNALKYTPKEGLVEISLAIDPASPGRVILSVKDSGIGIKSEDLNAIFSGFYRTAGGKSAAKGFGVGLKVARELVEAHGSRLEANSSPGIGSVFSFSLAVADGPVS